MNVFLSGRTIVDIKERTIGIVGAGKLMPMGSPLIRPGKVTVVYGKPLTDDQRELLRTSRNDTELAEMMRQCVADCVARANQPAV